MRRIDLAALCLAVVLVFAACAAENPSVPYSKGECEHVFGYWYDVSAVTCLDVGQQIRYCKLCQTAEEQTIDVASDIEERKHSFIDTVTPPTEASGGYTTRVCTLCEYRKDRIDPTPALYELVSDEATLTALPTGLSGVLLSDTVTHRLARYAPTGVHPEIARLLAAALVVTDELSRKSTILMPFATLTVTDELLADIPAGAAVSPRSFYAGAVVTLEQTLGLWITTGGADAALVLAEFLGITHEQFAAAATQRAENLGLVDTAFTSLIAPDDFGTSSLYDTATLLCRALDEELITEPLLLLAQFSFVKIGEKQPVVWLTGKNLRVSAIREGESIRFLLLAGENMPNGIEAELFAE